VVDYQCFYGLLLVVAIAGLLPVAAIFAFPVCIRLPVFLSEPLIKLIDLMLMMWVVWVLWFHRFIFGLLFISGFAGFLPVVAGGVCDKCPTI